MKCGSTQYLRRRGPYSNAYLEIIICSTAATAMAVTYFGEKTPEWSSPVDGAWCDVSPESELEAFRIPKSGVVGSNRSLK